MDASQYGPFLQIVTIAGALVATFGVLMFKMLGRLKRWAWLAVDSPSFLVAAGARVVTVALMAATYIFITPANYRWFAGAAVVAGILGFLCIARFDYLRRLHVAQIPLVGATGKQLTDKHGQPMSKAVIIGTEQQLRPDVAADLGRARTHGGVSLLKFMSGYGAPVNDPETLWDREVLVSIANKLCRTLTYIALLAVLVIFLSAFVIQIADSKPG